MFSVFCTNIWGKTYCTYPTHTHAFLRVFLSFSLLYDSLACPFFAVSRRLPQLVPSVSVYRYTFSRTNVVLLHAEIGKNIEISVSHAGSRDKTMLVQFVNNDNYTFLRVQARENTEPMTFEKFDKNCTCIPYLCYCTAVTCNYTCELSWTHYDFRIIIYV